jgi:hypothetical protein
MDERLSTSQKGLFSVMSWSAGDKIWGKRILVSITRLMHCGWSLQLWSGLSCTISEVGTPVRQTLQLSLVDEENG